MVTSRFTLGAALVVLIQLIVPTGAAAQASREGPSFAAAGGWGTVRLPDVAFDACQRRLPDRLRQPNATAGS